MLTLSTKAQGPLPRAVAVFSRIPRGGSTGMGLVSLWGLFLVGWVWPFSSRFKISKQRYGFSSQIVCSGKRALALGTNGIH